MTSLRLKHFLKWSLRLLLIVVLMGVVWLAPTVHEYLRIMSAHSAKVTCSERYIAQRPFDEILATDIYAREVQGIPAFNLMRVSLAESAARTHSSLLGLPLYSDSAVYRPGLGCVLVRGASAEALRQAAGPTAVVPPLPEAPWPLGNQVSYAENPALEAALEAAFSNPRTGEPLGTRAVVVVHNGQIIGERYAPGFTPETPLIGWSMTKSVTAMLAGIMLERSDLRLDSDRLFPEWQDERAAVRLKDLLSMSDGLDFVNGTAQPSDELRQLYFAPDTLAFAAEKPLLYQPGTVFNYANGSTTLVMGLLREQIAQESDWLNFPIEALFAPLGMRSAVWETDPSGLFNGASLLYATPRDWARLGLLMAQEGRWQGEQILPEGWAEYMASPDPATNGGWYGNGFMWRGLPDWNVGVEIPEDDYWMNGFDGQMVIVIPSEDLVIVRMGLTPNGGFNLRPDLVGPILNALPEN